MSTTKWHPIATAPRMRNIIMFAWTDAFGAEAGSRNYRMGSGTILKHGDEETVEWEGRKVRNWDWSPTLWTELPEPPAAEGADNK